MGIIYLCRITSHRINCFRFILFADVDQGPERLRSLCIEWHRKSGPASMYVIQICTDTGIHPQRIGFRITQFQEPFREVLTRGVNPDY